MTEDELEALVGRRFAGGRYRIAHWESFLLTDCTGAARLPEGQVHPIALFHVPILGSGTSIAQLFEWCEAAGAGSVGLLSYDWEYLAPLREDVEYKCEGGIVEATRSVGPTGRVADTVAFQIELSDGEDTVARVTNRWQINRAAT